MYITTSNVSNYETKFHLAVKIEKITQWATGRQPTDDDPPLKILPFEIEVDLIKEHKEDDMPNHHWLPSHLHKTILDEYTKKFCKDFSKPLSCQITYRYLWQDSPAKESYGRS